MVIAAVARMRASSGLWSWRNAAALFWRRAQGRPSAWQLIKSMAWRYIETALLALPCLRKQLPASLRRSGEGLVTLPPLHGGSCAALPPVATADILVTPTG